MIAVKGSAYVCHGGHGCCAGTFVGAWCAPPVIEFKLTGARCGRAPRLHILQPQHYVALCWLLRGDTGGMAACCKQPIEGVGGRRVPLLSQELITGRPRGRSSCTSLQLRYGPHASLTPACASSSRSQFEGAVCAHRQRPLPERLCRGWSGLELVRPWWDYAI